MKLKGFTLAEVLITLAIIGIVAALTIPSVISNYQQQEFKTGLKKAVSVLNEAIQTNIATDGETPYENEDLFNYLQRHMSVLKKEESTVYTCQDNNLKVVDTGGNFCSGNLSGNRLFYTTDGMRFEIPTHISKTNGVELKLHESGYSLTDSVNNRPYNRMWSNGIQGNCGSLGLNNNSKADKSAPCIVSVDVNGDKKPNYFLSGGKSFHDMNPTNAATAYTYPSVNDKKLMDIFSILITEDRAIPFGVVAQRAMYSK